MKKIILSLFTVFYIFSLGGCAPVDNAKQVTSNTVLEKTFEYKTSKFEISNLQKYHGVVIKEFTLTDSLQSDNPNQNREIIGTQPLGSLLGKQNSTYQTNYIYVGKKQIEEKGEVKWYYYYPPSWNGRAQSKLKYKVNDVMLAARSGDLLVVGKTGNNEIDLIIIPQNSAAEKQVYDFLNKKQEPDKRSVSVQSNEPLKNIENAQPQIELPDLKIEKIPKETYIQVYFSPSKDCENNIIKYINTSKKIDMFVYGLTNRSIIDSVLAAQKRGAKVRVITDRLQSTGKSALADELEAVGLPVRTNLGTKHKIEHNKVAVFDDKVIVTGSYNWTETATKNNSENCLFTNDAKTTKAYSERFKYLWKFYEK